VSTPVPSSHQYAQIHERQQPLPLWESSTLMHAFGQITPEYQCIAGVAE
jgi:hypothetical protein